MDRLCYSCHMGWHEERFLYSETKIRFDCVSCGKPMYFPKSKAGKYRTCSHECREAESAKQLEKRKRNCLTCNKVFYPRTEQIRLGIGLYCSHACSTHVRVDASKKTDAIKKRVNSYKENIASGKTKLRIGEDNPRWKGGKQAYLQRRKESGKSAESLRIYRKNNPEKIKEFSLRRKSKKYGRLPKGTIKKIGDSQNWMCVVCRSNIKNSYHVDHIFPISKGGEHSATNIQLLCPTCNVRKSDKDPIKFMQENGFLL